MRMPSVAIGEVVIATPRFSNKPTQITVFRGERSDIFGVWEYNKPDEGEVAVGIHFLDRDITHVFRKNKWRKI